jgi:hypothetical protein
MATELYINNQQIELSETDVIALSFAVNNIAELQDRSANYSNRFSLKKTRENRRILGFSDVLNSTDKAPYRLLPAKIVQTGIETIPNGVAIIEESSKTFNVTIYSGIFDFFSKIDGKSIRDLNLSELDHEWSAASAADATGNTSGYTYPIIQTGLVSLTGNSFHLKYQMPSVFVHSIINQIFIEAGFIKGGSIVNNLFYKSLIIPGTPPDNTDDFIEPRTSLIGIAGVTAGANNTTFPVPFTLEAPAYGQDFKDGSQNNFNPATYTYTADISMWVKVDIQVVTAIFATIGEARGKLKIIRNGIEYAGYDGTTDNGFQNLNLAPTEEIYLDAGDSIYAFIEFEASTDIYDYTWAIHGTFGDDSYFSITPTTRHAMGSVIEVAKVLPDISQKDFVKAILGHMFGSIFQANNITSVIDIRQFKEIYANKPIAKNWSSKLDLSIEPVIKYRLGDYGQENSFKYIQDELNYPKTKNNISTLTSDGNGSILIDDKNLKPKVTVVDLPFAASTSQDVLSAIGIRCAVFPRFILNEDDAIEEQDPVPRILAVKRQDATIRYVNEDGSYVDTTGLIPVAYFEDPNENYNLSFDNNLIDQSYGEIRDGIFVRTKVLNAYFNLAQTDIAELDFFIPVFVDYYNEYFYINQISDFIENRSTLCELVRL